MTTNKAFRGAIRHSLGPLQMIEYPDGLLVIDLQGKIVACGNFLYKTPNLAPVSEIPEEHLQDRTKFIELSTKGTSRCYLPNKISEFSNDYRMTGSCCGPMYEHIYYEQLDGLKKYADIREIPQDPYDISVSQIKQMLKFDAEIQLTPEEQKIYDSAVPMSADKGPCCCSNCWRYDAYRGLAKFLIIEYDFGSEEIAHVWDLSEGCGGEDHIEDAHA